MRRPASGGGDLRGPGAKELKNLARPVRAYRLCPAVPSASPATSAGAPPRCPRATARTSRRSPLPLDNMSGDPEQEFFADGITEDIITELSRWLASCS